MFRRILFVTDGSYEAQNAGDYAAALAIRFHGKVTILHAYTQPGGRQGSYPFPNVDAYATQQEAETLVAQAAERMRNHGVPDVSVEVIQGQPVHVILGYAETNQPDVIVMGARGVGTWQGLLLGSTSMSVVQRSQVPVLVVK